MGGRPSRVPGMPVGQVVRSNQAGRGAIWRLISPYLLRGFEKGKCKKILGPVHFCGNRARQGARGRSPPSCGEQGGFHRDPESEGLLGGSSQSEIGAS